MSGRMIPAFATDGLMVILVGPVADGAAALVFFFVNDGCGGKVAGRLGDDDFSWMVVGDPACMHGVVALACGLLGGLELWILIVGVGGSDGEELPVVVPVDVVPGFRIFCLGAGGVGRASCTNGCVLPSLSCFIAISR